jgi:hypothetical protein
MVVVFLLSYLPVIIGRFWPVSPLTPALWLRGEGEEARMGATTSVEYTDPGCDLALAAVGYK